MDMKSDETPVGINNLLIIYSKEILDVIIN